jgi:hypothetical protein
MYYQASNETAFLKLLQHVRDNRIGPVCHHCVLTATDIMVGIRCDRLEDGAEICMRKLVKKRDVRDRGSW